MATRHAARIGSPAAEAFWYSVVCWFARGPALEPNEIRPLFDYVEVRRRESASFTMKGRSGIAMLRAMKEWHGRLGATKAVPDTIFRSSGYEDGELRDSRCEANGSSTDELWRIKELLSAKELFEEGTQMGHCVYEYAPRVERGDTSVWSVRMTDDRADDRRIVTVEVQNDLKRIVQVRGRFNRPASTKELRVIATWADTNRLRVDTSA